MFGIKAYFRCRVVKRKMPYYFAGELNIEAIAGVDQHLKKCERCREYYDKSRKVWNILKASAAKTRRIVGRDDGDAFKEFWRQVGVKIVASRRRQK